MRYSVSGSNTTAVSGGTGGATGLVQYLLGKGITTGRVFWLRGIYVSPNGTDAGASIYDASAGSTVDGEVAVLRLTGVTSAAVVNGSGIWNLPAPGLKFTTGVAVRFDGSGVATGVCTGAIGSLGGWGYEE